MSDVERTGTPDDPSRMSLLDHIAELRRTLIWAVAIGAIAAVASWFISDEIVNTLLRPARLAGQSALYFHAPMEAFMLKLKASSAVGLLLVFPLILYKLYSFVLPGLTAREKRTVTPMLVAATALFYVGVSFCFFVLMPMVIRFAVSFATDSLKPLLTAGYYFDFAAKLCLAFGILFELPMVIFALSWVGIVQPRTLLRGWRYALVAIATVAAILTPPDPLSQIMLLVPVMLLYIGSVLVAMAVRRRRTRDADEDDDGPDDDGPDDGGPGDDGPDAHAEGDPSPRKEPAPDVRPASDTVARERGDRGSESDGPHEDPESDSPPSGGN